MAATNSGEVEIHIWRDEAQSGPFSLEEVLQAVEEGRLANDDYAWRAGMSQWQPLGLVLATLRRAPAKLGKRTSQLVPKHPAALRTEEEIEAPKVAEAKPRWRLFGR